LSDKKEEKSLSAMSKNAGLDDICQLGGDHTTDDGQWQLALANQCLEALHELKSYRIKSQLFTA